MRKRFTIPSLEQVSGDKMLDVLKRYGIVAGVTEYAAKRGAETYKLKGKYFVSKGMEPRGDLLNQTCCDYWTSTKADGSIGKAYTVSEFEINAEPSWTSENGIRLIVPLEDIQDEIEDSYTISGMNGDIKVVLYGEYPQSVVSHDEARELYRLYEDGVMKPTGKKYGAEGYSVERFYDGDERDYEVDDYLEYELDGVKYVLAKCSVFDNGFGRYFWSRVEPIEWLVDEATGLAISKKCIVGGIPLKRNGLYLGNINKTKVQKFIDNELSCDIEVKRNIVRKAIDGMMDETVEELENEKSL